MFLETIADKLNQAREWGGGRSGCCALACVDIIYGCFESEVPFSEYRAIVERGQGVYHDEVMAYLRPLVEEKLASVFDYSARYLPAEAACQQKHRLALRHGARGLVRELQAGEAYGLIASYFPRNDDLGHSVALLPLKNTGQVLKIDAMSPSLFGKTTARQAEGLIKKSWRQGVVVVIGPPGEK